MVFTSHPLGGCLMADSAVAGVTDEFGRVFREPGAQPFYKGLYIADGSVIPTALGVNPSFTISAVALRTADKILEEWDQIPSTAAIRPTSPQCKLPSA